MAYKPDQVAALVNEFNVNKYLTSQRMRELGTALNLKPRQVKIWFQNRRMKEKRVKKNTDVDSTTDSTDHLGSPCSQSLSENPELVENNSVETTDSRIHPSFDVMESSSIEEPISNPAITSNTTKETADMPLIDPDISSEKWSEDTVTDLPRDDLSKSSCVDTDDSQYFQVHPGFDLLDSNIEETVLAEARSPNAAYDTISTPFIDPGTSFENWLGNTGFFNF